MTPTRTIAAFLAAGALLFAACGDDDDSASPDETSETTAADNGEGSEAGAGEVVDTVDILDFEFDPADATVAAGSEVTFTNADGTAHTATASDGSLLQASSSRPHTTPGAVAPEPSTD